MRSDGVTEEWVHPIQPSRPDRPTVRQRTRAERPFWGDTAEGRWRLTSSMNGRPIAISWMENTGGIREAARLACRILVSTPQRLRGAELFICVPLLFWHWVWVGDPARSHPPSGNNFLSLPSNFGAWESSKSPLWAPFGTKICKNQRVKKDFCFFAGPFSSFLFSIALKIF